MKNQEQLAKRKKIQLTTGTLSGFILSSIALQAVDTGMDVDPFAQSLDAGRDPRTISRLVTVRKHLGKVNKME